MSLGATAGAVFDIECGATQRPRALDAVLDGCKVLVCGINYAPEYTGIAPYTTQACEYFAKLGADVLALTGVPHYPSWTVPDQYRRCWRSDETHAGVQVRRLRHYVPSRQSAARRTAYEVTFGVRVVTQRLPWSPNVVVAVVPSLFGAVAAARLAERHGARLVVWVQDLMGLAAARSGIAGGSRIAALTGVMERWVLRRADEVLVLNDAFRSHVERAGVPDERVRLVRNWNHVPGSSSDRLSVRERLGWADDEVVALHSGNMGLKQGLENVLAAARLAEGTKVRFVLMGDGNQRTWLQQGGQDVPTLSFLPPASREDFPDILAASDVLLVSERASALDMSLPSKLTSYFRASVPVLAAVPAGGGTAHEIERAGAGRLVPPDDPQALLDGVQALVSDAAACLEYRARALKHVNENLSASSSLARIALAMSAPHHPRREPGQ